MQPVMSSDASVMLMICRNGKDTVRITTSEGLALPGPRKCLAQLDTIMFVVITCHILALLL
jgi:hypothetical protein